MGMAQCEHADIDGARCGLAPGHGGGHVTASVQTRQCEHTSSAGARCVHAHGHTGLHLTRPSETQTCQAVWAPNPKEAYECIRLDGHGGFHLDDRLNMMWRSSYGDREQPMGDARHSADKAGEPSTEPPTSPDRDPESFEAYIHGALDGLKARIEALEQVSEPMAPLHRILNAVEWLTCTARMEVSGAEYDCTLTKGHGGYHQDSDPGNLEWALKHL